MRRARRPLTAWRRPTVVVCSVGLLATGVARADTCSSLAFGSLSVTALSSAPLALAVGDFNRDGRPDEITVGTGGTVSILLGNPSGGFFAPSPIATITGAVDVLPVDYNRDGKLDLVVANALAASVSLIPGNGNGSFGSATTLTLAGTPATLPPGRIALGDFNRDGRPDLVTLSGTGGQVRVFAGTGSGFATSPVADLSVPSASSAVAADFNRDGKLDLAVASNASPYRVLVFLGDGTGHLGDSSIPPNPFSTVATGTNPVDLVAGDLNRDGKLDLVTANAGSADVSVLLGGGDGTFTASVGASIGGTPRRVRLLDLDRDGVLDLAVLDDTGPRMVALRGLAMLPPAFDTVPYQVVLAGTPVGLAVADFDSDGRPDLATALSLSPTSQTVVLSDLSGASGANCAHASFGDAPRSYPAGRGPVAAAVADFDSDGRPDLIVADYFTPALTLLTGSPSGFVTAGTALTLPSAPRGVAAADFDSDGLPDVVVALGNEVRLYRGNGLGGFSLSATQPAGTNVSAVVVGDFNGDGAPDAAVASEGSNTVYVFLGDGHGGLGPGSSIGVGTAPRALAVADFNGDGKLDLAVACATTSNVWILQGNGLGGFTALGAKPTVGAGPWGIVAADLDADAKIDLVTANHDSGSVSVLKGNGDGSFLAATSYTVSGGIPTGVAAVDIAGSARPDIVVSDAATHTVSVLVDNGPGIGYTTLPKPFAVRTSPQAVIPVDANRDGQLDVAVPCRDSDAVVVLSTNRASPPSGPLATAATVAVGQAPAGALAVDLDGDGDLDLVVANSTDNTLSLLRNDGGIFTLYASLPVGKTPGSIVAADFNRDGVIDLAVNAPGEAPEGIYILFGNPLNPGTFQTPYVKVNVGTNPDALAVGDFDRDGDIDLAVCDAAASGSVRILLNNGAGGFSAGATIPVGNMPTAIVAGDFDRDGDLDLAVVDNGTDDVYILLGDGTGAFAKTGQSPIGLTTLARPVAIAAGDLDGDGDLDLAVACFGTKELGLLQNDFPSNPGHFTVLTPIPVPDVPVDVSAADLNRDGKLDLAVAVTGSALWVLRGKGAVTFEEGEQFVAGRTPVAAAVGDFNRDGRPDVALVNKDSTDVSILLSTTCTARRLDAAVQPPAPPSCGGVAVPYSFPATVQALDDGGNLAACTPGTVSAAILPGTGDPGASLGGTTTAPLSSGQATFSGLTIDRAGKRYRMAFTLSGLPQATSRRFTLGNELTITGPSSFCPSSSASYSATPGFDTYAWTKDAGPTPSWFTPTILVQNPADLASGPHTLSASARVDSCTGAASTSVYVGTLQSVTLAASGFVTVCVDCIGGTVTPTETGGGAVVSRQWGYRTLSGGAITDLPLETGPTYTIKGTDFPGPGDYFVVVRTTPTCPATPTVSSELLVTVYEAPPSGDVLSLGVRSGGAPADGHEKLFWVNADATADEILIRWRRAASATADCVYPTSPLGSTPADGGDVPLTDAATLTAVRTEYEITGLPVDRNHCYAVFVRRGANWSPGRLVKGRPFDASSGPVKWAYSTGATAVVPPTIGPNGIVAVSNDRSVHSLTRGSGGGDWPPSWVPPALLGVANSRSPIVPFGPTSSFFPGKSIFFTADDTGAVFAIDSLTGQIEWTSTPSAATTMTGAPGAILTNGGNPGDLVLVGSRNLQPANPSAFYRLDLGSGSLVTPAFTGSPSNLGPVNGAPSIDAGDRRVTFASRRLGTGPTIWCLSLPESGDPSLAWSRADLGEFDSSPVQVGGRVYVANDTVYSLDAATGADDRSFPTLDGLVKGFVFPDRRGNDLIFATDHKVTSVSDDGSATLPKNWEWTVPGGGSPSMVLYWPETNLVYVGGPGGELYELDFTNATPSIAPTVKQIVLGDGRDQIGVPSLDRTPPGTPAGKGLLVVGSESGVLYGVEVPLP